MSYFLLRNLYNTRNPATAGRTFLRLPFPHHPTKHRRQLPSAMHHHAHLFAATLVAVFLLPACAKTLIKRRTYFITSTLKASTDMPAACKSRTRCPILRSTPVCNVYKGGNCRTFCERTVPCKSAKKQFNQCLSRCRSIRGRTTRKIHALFVLKGGRAAIRLFRRTKTVRTKCFEYTYSDSSRAGACGAQSFYSCWACGWLDSGCAGGCTGSRRNLWEFAL